MNFFILSWNVRGIGKVEKYLHIKDIVNSSFVGLFVLLETKLKSISRVFLWQLCLFALVDRVCLLSKALPGIFGLSGIPRKLKFCNPGLTNSRFLFVVG